MPASPAQTFAFIVGVEQYQPATFSALNGPANDACRFAEWLLQRGVPAANLTFLLAPLPENAALPQRYEHLARALQAGELQQQFAAHDTVVNAVNRLAPKAQGDLLWFFWGGHGLSDVQGARLLFYADAQRDNLRPLDLNSLLTAAQTAWCAGLRRQIFIIDACANYRTFDYALPKDEFPVYAAVPPGEQSVLFAASLRQRAVNLSSRKAGAFSEAVLTELENSGPDWPPDIAALSRKLDEKFETLRAAGETKQRPSFYSFSQPAGFSVQRGSLHLLPAARPAMAGVPHWGFADRFQVVDALLQIDTMSNPKFRQMVLDNLPGRIKHSIVRADDNRRDVEQIVRRAEQYEGGLAGLVEIVRVYEGDTMLMRSLDDLLAQLLPGMFQPRPEN